MTTKEASLPPVNQQGLDICSTPRAEMNLFPLDTFPYEFPGKEIRINFEITEFTAVCPFSDFPDFATIRIEYVPNERCIELKSLKLYINSFRNVKVFHEHVTNIILEDFVAACDPIRVEIEGDFHVRGNIKTVIKATYVRKNSHHSTSQIAKPTPSRLTEEE
jgi:7-cyano-7-deazaguanine reductase